MIVDEVEIYTIKSVVVKSSHIDTGSVPCYDSDVHYNQETIIDGYPKNGKR